MNAPINIHNLQAAAMWGSTGRRYDEVSRWISSGIEHCVERLAPMQGERVLDVATGTGWTARRVAARGAKVTGIDIAEGMLNAAKEIASEDGLDIDYQLADAEALPFENGEFDQTSTDLIGFTKIAEQLSTTELIDELNYCFKGFDEIIQRNRIEKIKTIGDGYMAVGGVPDPRADHVQAVAELALALPEIVSSLPQGTQLSLRVGIETGPLVAAAS